MLCTRVMFLQKHQPSAISIGRNYLSENSQEQSQPCLTLALPFSTVVLGKRLELYRLYTGTHKGAPAPLSIEGGISNAFKAHHRALITVWFAVFLSSPKR